MEEDKVTKSKRGTLYQPRCHFPLSQERKVAVERDLD